MKILVLNGPNLNMLGLREKSIYGAVDYNNLVKIISDKASEAGFSADVRQSNHEGELIDIIQQAREKYDVIIINAGAYTHTSIGIRDALLSISIPFIEVHISNIFSREEFRSRSYLSDKAIGVITGFGISSYLMAIDYCKYTFSNK